MAVVLLEELEAFAAAVDSGSLTAAAQRLGCAQSVVSRRIQHLEQGLGVRVLDRGSYGVRLTGAGEHALAFAREVLDAYTGLRSRLGDAPAPASGSLRVAASTIPGEYLVPALIARFSERYPHARTDLLVADTAQVYEALLARTVHVGFVGHRAKRANDTLTFTPFARDEVVLAAAAGYPLPEEDELEVDQLVGHRILSREAGSGTQRTFHEAITAAGLSLPAPLASVSLGSTRAVVSAVAAGLGLGIVSVRALQEQPGHGLRTVRLRGVRATRVIWLAYETHRARAPLHAAFIAYATEAADRGS